MAADRSANQRRDVLLIGRFRQGDMAAAETLLGHYKPMVRERAGAFFLPGADREDIIQEGMLGLFAAIRQYDESRGPFAALADIAVVTHIKDAVRRANRRQNEPLNRSVSLDDDAAAIGAVSRPNEMAETEQLEAIRHFMQNELSPREREVAKLYIAGYSYADIAAKLGIVRKSVDNAMSRIRRKFELRR